jgi:hypothetical protein
MQLEQRVLTPKQHQPLEVNDWAVVQAQKVEISELKSEKKTSAIISINDGEIIHQFKPTSRVSQSLSFTPPEALAKRMVGGKFFTINNTLVDFRDGSYNGFIQDNTAIQQLIDTIGVAKVNPLARAIKVDTTQSDILLSNPWGEQTLDITEYQQGGLFTSQLSYSWSPFSQHIRGVFELIRQICTNGMVGLTEFFNAKIPMINRWEEHMDISYTQIQNKVQSRVKARILEMGRERATVGELLAITDHANLRIKQMHDIHPDELHRLRTISNIANPQIHLADIYLPNVFDDRSVAQRVVGHLSSFDAWNLVTEMYSHTTASTNSSDIGLQRMANAFLLEGEQRNKRLLHVERDTRVPNAFLDPTQAFYGVMQ